MNGMRKKKKKKEQYGNLVVSYWAGEPVQVKGGNAKYRRYRVQVAKRTIAREKGERHVLLGYFVCCHTRERTGLYSPDIVGSYIYFSTTLTGWQLARVVGMAEDAESIAHVQDAGPGEAIECTSVGAYTINHQRGAWCWHVHRRTRSVKNYALSLG